MLHTLFIIFWFIYVSRIELQFGRQTDVQVYRSTEPIFGVDV